MAREVVRTALACATVLALGASGDEPVSGSAGQAALQGEVVFILVSSSELPVNAGPAFLELIGNIKSSLAAKAEASDVDFATMGVSLDWDPRRGWDYLMGTTRGDANAFGPWDEVHVGRNWRNDVVVEHIFRAGREGMTQEEVPVTAIPQLLIIERTIGEVREARSRSLSYGPNVTLLRIVGIGAMRQWLEDGLPLPQSELLN